LIQSYIDSGILLNQQVVGITKSELELLFQGNLTVNLNTGIPELKANPVLSGIDNIQLLPANSYGKTSYIYYKSVQGMSVSSDFGVSQALISNDNLKFPDEITSFAVQVYDSNNGVLQEVNRLFIGTLREGVKTFTPGKDFTYVDFEPDASIVGAPLFKNSLTTTLITKDENNVEYDINGIGSLYGLTLDANRKNANGIYYPISPQSTYTFTNFCATFVIALVNNPTNSGCPILIATRSKHFAITTTTVINSITGVASNPTVNTANNYETKLVFKYLHSKIYNNGDLVDTIPVINQPVTYVADNRWCILTNGSFITAPIQGFKEHITDVITEYTPDGAIFVLKGLIIGETGLSNTLYKITCSTNISAIPVISLLGSDAADEMPIPGKINSISYVKDIASNNYYIFIAQNEVVYKYSSYNSTWIEFLNPGNTITYFSTSINSNGILDSAGTLWLKELTKFVMIPKNNTPNEYTGILSSELGLIIYNLKLVNNEFIAGAKSARTTLQNVAKSIISDLQTNIFGENIRVLTCSYSSQIPRMFYENTNCLRLINDSSDLVKNVYYLKSDAEPDDSIYYVTANSAAINYMLSPEQLIYNPVLVNSDYAYNLISPMYEYKLSNLTYDDILVNELQDNIVYKYYYPYVKERIISSISPAERNILTLTDFKHLIKMPYLNQVNSSNIILGTPIDISNQSIIVLQDTYAIKQTGPSTFVYNAFVCIDLAGNVVIPTSITTLLAANGLFSTTITFRFNFSGRIYQTYTETDPVSYTVSGLFLLISHNMGAYPQVILDELDPTLWDKLNDIRYVDPNRLEISFKSEINTTISLLGLPYNP
jgi:hypothetical protein